MKVTEVSNSRGLMVTVPILQWREGVFSLLNKAESEGIIPNAIAFTKLEEVEEETMMSIILWGDK